MQDIFNNKIPLKVYLFENGLVKFILFGWNIGFVSAVIKSLSNHIKIDQTSIIHTHGLISKVEKTVDLYRIKDINYNQNILERLVGTGSLTILTDDNSIGNFKLSITNPKSIIDKLKPLIRDDRKNMKSVNYD